MRKGQSEYVNLICQKLELLMAIEEIENAMNKFLIEEDEFLEMAKIQLTDFEKKVVHECSIKNRSFQKVSDDINYTYREVRDTWIAARDKLNIIAKILDE